MPVGNYSADIFADGVNANRIGNDYLKTVKNISKRDSMNIKKMKSGGFAIKLTPVQN
ncbi:MAG: glycoside hydrolase family 97 C-terminal domain-containing protein [Ginsengibacter sp.]